MTQEVDTPDVQADTDVAEDRAGAEVTESQAFGGENESGEIGPESIVEALLFASNSAIGASRMAQIVGIGNARDVKRHIESLNERYESTGASFRIKGISGGYQMFTQPSFDPWIHKLHKAKAETRLSQAALETLAIVAYRQPIIRANIEAVRGVAVGDVLIRLRDMKLVKIVGRAEDVGRPLLYGTTNRFLEVFGLPSLKDLPKLDEDSPEQVPTLRIAPPDTEDADAAEGPAEAASSDTPNL
jgi:segregation and condensation protein B